VVQAQEVIVGESAKGVGRFQELGPHVAAGTMKGKSALSHEVMRFIDEIL
jgi:hypothetical protein